MAQFAFALDSSDVIVSINQVSNMTRHDGFTCPDCSSPLIPNLKDNIKERHFRHAPGYPFKLGKTSECSGETDIHLRLKHAFAAAFCLARESGRLFHCALQQRHTCNSGCCETTPTWVNVDLAAYDEVKIERHVASFIPDCFLTDSTGHHPPIFVEVFVTSRPSREKIASKTAILELNSGYDRSHICLDAINALVLPHELIEWYNHDLLPLTDFACRYLSSWATPVENAISSPHRGLMHTWTAVSLSPPESYVGVAAKGRSLLTLTWFPSSDARILWDTQERYYLIIHDDVDYGRFANHGRAYDFCCSLKAPTQGRKHKAVPQAELDLFDTSVEVTPDRGWAD